MSKKGYPEKRFFYIRTYLRPIFSTRLSFTVDSLNVSDKNCSSNLAIAFNGASAISGNFSSRIAMGRVSHVNQLGVLEKSEHFQIFRLCSVAHIMVIPVFGEPVKSAKTGTNSIKFSSEKPWLWQLRQIRVQFPNWGFRPF